MAIIAFVTAVSPLAHDLWSYWIRPSVIITSPPPDFISGSRGFSVTGVSRHIPEADDLWLLVRAPGNFWFPLDKIPPNGQWGVAAHMICYRMGPGQQDLQVWMIPDTADSSLIAYMDDNNSTKPVTQLPPGSTLETHRIVQVPKHIKVSC